MFRFTYEDRETFKMMFWMSVFIPIAPIVAIFVAERWNWAGFFGAVSAWLLVASFLILLASVPPDFVEYIGGFIVIASIVVVLLIFDFIFPFAVICFIVAMFILLGDFQSMPACYPDC